MLRIQVDERKRMNKLVVKVFEHVLRQQIKLTLNRHLMVNVHFSICFEGLIEIVLPTIFEMQFDSILNTLFYLFARVKPLN